MAEVEGKITLGEGITISKIVDPNHTFYCCDTCGAYIYQVAAHYKWHNDMEDAKFKD